MSWVSVAEDGSRYLVARLDRRLWRDVTLRRTRFVILPYMGEDVAGGRVFLVDPAGEYPMLRIHNMAVFAYDKDGWWESSDPRLRLFSQRVRDDDLRDMACMSDREFGSVSRTGSLLVCEAHRRLPGIRFIS